MKPDRRFVEDVERTGEVAAQRGREVDALALAAREGRRQAVERQVAQPHVGEVLQAVADFDEDARRRFRVVFVEFQPCEEGDQGVHGHRHQIGDRLAADAYVQRLFAQARAAAFGTGGLARVAGLHHAELDFAPLRVDVFEKFVESVEIFVAAPQQPFLLGRQFVERRVDRESELRGVLHELLLPFAHRLAPPAGHGVLVNGLALVGDHQVLVDADHLAVALAPGAGPQRVVEAEEVFRGAFELDAVGLEARRELPYALVRDDFADVPAVGEGAGHRVADAGLRVLVRRYAHAVDDDPDFVGPGVGTDSGQHVLDQPHFAARVDPHETLREQQRQFFDDPLPFAQYQRCADDHALSVAGENPGRHVIHAEAAHLLPRDGRKGVPRAGEQQFEVVVDFSRRAHGRTGVARVDLLLDGDGRRDARDDIHVGFVDLPEELPGVGREALDVAALPLGENRVEGQRRLARAGESRHDDEFVVRNFDLDVAEVVDPRSFDIYGVFVFFHVTNIPIRFSECFTLAVMYLLVVKGAQNHPHAVLAGVPSDSR